MHENKANIKETLIGKNLLAISDRISAAAITAGRQLNDVKLLAVSKFHSTDKVRAALEGGHRLFGENRVQEAAQKYPILKSEFPDLRLHLIGPLQSNKVRQAVKLFDVIETMDRPRLAEALFKEREKSGVCPDLYIQVNTGEETQKSGVLPENLDDLINLCRDELELPVKGLMCIPPVNDESALHFALLATMAKRYNFQYLSMGMSSDFEIAIKLGATHVRIGTNIFGAREIQN